MIIEIPNTSIEIEVSRVLDESNNPTEHVICLVRDNSIAEPDFNPITFLSDASYNVVAKQYFKI